MSKSIVKLTTFLFLFHFSFIAATAQNLENSRLFVNENMTTGNQDGVDWANAYPNLQTALQNAAYGDEIWVANGTYYPDSMTDRSKSFLIPPGVKVYGGFEGTEGALGQRISGEYPSILSGNIGLQNDSTDNTFHVVEMINPDDNTLIDGFTISGGFALRSPAGTDQDVGGGINIRVDADSLVGWPGIYNCTFLNNVARRGGAISAQAVSALSSGLVVKNTVFENNNSTSFGGAIYLKAEKESTIVTSIEACRFMSNSSGHIAGAVYCADIPGTIQFSDCMFFQNFAPTMAGAIGILQEDNKSHYVVDQTTFSKNITFGGGGAFQYVSQKPLEGTIEILRSEFSENRAFNNAGGALNMTNFGGKLDLKVDQSSFLENSASKDGAAISIYDELFGTSNIHFTNSRIEKNKVTSFSGSAYFYNQEFVRRGSGNQTVFYNTLFANNDGAYTFLGSSSAVNDTYIYNCTFFQNGNQPIVNWSKLESNDLRNTLHIWLKNSIIWEPAQYSMENILISIAPVDGTSLYEYNLDHNIFNALDCESFTDNYFCGSNNIFGLDPELKDPARGDFSLKQCSPAINAGLKDALLDTLNQGFDLNSNARILEDIPDIGAFEMSSFTFEVQSIRLPNCPGGQDGEVQVSVPTDQLYEIKWQSGISTDNQLDQLVAGDYAFTLATDDGCTYSLPFTLNGPDTMQVDYNIIPASGPNSMDGSISLGSVRGGTSPHRVEVLQDSQAFTLGNLAPGTYELRVTDRKGCVISEEVVISFVSDVINLEDGVVLKAFPNPVLKGQDIRLNWSGLEGRIKGLRLLDLRGRTLWHKKKNGHFSSGELVESGLLESGIYLLQIMDEKGRNHTLKLIVK